MGSFDALGPHLDFDALARHGGLAGTGTQLAAAIATIRSARTARIFPHGFAVVL
jgi:hypothetical protein